MCVVLGKGLEDWWKTGRSSRSRRSRSSFRTRRSSTTRSSSRRSIKSMIQARRPDPSSSPIGGACLSCGSIVTEETSLYCPNCGTARSRCPICQRFVVGGQELLACPHCKSLGHANEMVMWIQRKEKCPYCARKLNALQLKTPEELGNWNKSRIRDYMLLVTIGKGEHSQICETS